MVSNKSKVDILCDSIRNDTNLSRFKKLHFEKLEKEDKVKLEETMYQMVWALKNSCLEISEPIPRRLHTTIDQRWSNCIISERQIREATLA